MKSYKKPKYNCGGKVKQYSVGGDIAKGVGAGLYGITEGALDNLTFGLTDGLTDKGYNALAKLGNKDAEDLKRSNIIRASGNIVGQVAGAIGTGGATTTNAISGGLKGVNNIIQNTGVNDKTKNLFNAGTQLAGLGLSFAGGLKCSAANAPQQLQNIMNTSKQLQGSTGLMNTIGSLKFQSGGQVPNELMPYNPNQLDNVTQNTIQYDGNSHSQGGVPTPIGEFDKQEVVVKPQAVGNGNAYALSDNLKISKESAEMFGLNKSFVGKTLAEVAKSIENKKPQRDDKLHKETLELNKKKALEVLMKVNEFEMSKNQSENGVNSREDMSFQQANAYQSGGEIEDPDLSLPRQELRNAMTTMYNIPKNFQNSVNYPIPFENLANIQTMQTINPTQTDWGNRGAIVAGKLPPRYGLENLAQYNTEKLNTNPKLNRITASEPTVKENTPGLFSSMTDLEKIGLGLKSAARLGEIGMALKKPTKVATQYNPYKQQILENADNRIDNQAQKNTAQLMMNSALNNNSRSTNVQRALNNQIFSNSLNQLGQLDLANQQMNNQYKQQLSQTYNQLGVQDVQARSLAEDLNARTTANYRNNIRSAVGNLGNQTADYLVKRDIANKENNFNKEITTKMFDLYKEKASSLGGASQKFDEMFGDVLSSSEKALVRDVNSPEDLEKVVKSNPKLGEKITKYFKLISANE